MIDYRFPVDYPLKTGSRSVVERCAVNFELIADSVTWLDVVNDWIAQRCVFFCFMRKGEKTITKLTYFCRWIDWKKKQVKEQIYLFLNKFRGYFFFYLLSWCSSPGSRSRKFLQLTPHNGRYPTSRGLNIFSFYFIFFFIFDFYLNTFFFHIVMYIFWRCWRCHEKAIHHATRSFAFWNQTRNQRRRSKKK